MKQITAFFQKNPVVLAALIAVAVWYFFLRKPAAAPSEDDDGAVEAPNGESIRASEPTTVIQGREQQNGQLSEMRQIDPGYNPQVFETNNQLDEYLENGTQSIDGSKYDFLDGTIMN